MHYKYFIHRDCTFFPCHDLTEWRSCLFCWCPLYLLQCNGTFTFRGSVKDCSACTLPHTAEGYDLIVKSVSEQVYGK